METRPLVPGGVSNGGVQERPAAPAPHLRSALKPSPKPPPPPPAPVQLPMASTAAGAVLGAVGVARNAASSAVQAAATSIGLPSTTEPEASTKSSSLTARDKRKWDALRAVGNPMQTACMACSVLCGLLLLGVLGYMLLFAPVGHREAAGHVHRPTVTADPDGTTEREDLIWLPPVTGGPAVPSRPEHSQAVQNTSVVDGLGMSKPLGENQPD
ncbi:uncharacterized protein [Dermacentor albipictus]|uniref:uncharacterized protein n=1 Tax=Dermacentor albipictus TaxID=60249 RepID=UPI0031FD18F2